MTSNAVILRREATRVGHAVSVRRLQPLMCAIRSGLPHLGPGRLSPASAQRFYFAIANCRCVRHPEPPSCMSFRAAGEKSPHLARPRSLAFARDDNPVPCRAASSVVMPCRFPLAIPSRFRTRHSSPPLRGHSELQARNLRTSHGRDPLRSLGMTALLTPPAARAGRPTCTRCRSTGRRGCTAPSPRTPSHARSRSPAR